MFANDLSEVDIVQHNGQVVATFPSKQGPPPSTNACEVFIGGLPRELSIMELCEFLSPAGTLRQARLMVAHNGHTREQAFAIFSTPEEAKRAVMMLNGCLLKGRILGLRPSINKKFLLVSDSRMDIQLVNALMVCGGCCGYFKSSNLHRIALKAMCACVEHPPFKSNYWLLEFNTHREAALARREFKSWGYRVCWAQKRTPVTSLPLSSQDDSASNDSNSSNWGNENGLSLAEILFEAQKDSHNSLEAQIGQGFHSSQTDQGFHGSQTDQGFHGSQTDQGFHSSQTDQGFHGSQTDQGFHRSQTDQGFHGRQTAQGFHSSQTDQGFYGRQTDQGLHSSQTDQGFHSSQTGQGFHGRQTDQGFHSSQTDQGFYGRQTDQGLHSSQTDQGFHSSQTDQGFHSSQTDQEFHSLSLAEILFKAQKDSHNSLEAQIGQGFHSSQTDQGFHSSQTGQGFHGRQTDQGFHGSSEAPMNSYFNPGLYNGTARPILGARQLNVPQTLDSVQKSSHAELGLYKSIAECSNVTARQPNVPQSDLGFYESIRSCLGTSGTLGLFRNKENMQSAQGFHGSMMSNQAGLREIGSPGSSQAGFKQVGSLESGQSDLGFHEKSSNTTDKRRDSATSHESGSSGDSGIVSCRLIPARTVTGFRRRQYRF